MSQNRLALSCEYTPEAPAKTTEPAVNAVFVPGPPLATPSVPASVIVPLLVIGPPDVVRPVVPPLTATDVTVPNVSVLASSLTVPAAFLKYSFSSYR